MPLEHGKSLGHCVIAGLLGQGGMGEVYRARELWQESLPQVRESLASRPEDARIHSTLGHVLARLGRTGEAIAAGRNAVELYPTSLDAFHGPCVEMDLCRIYFEAGEVDLGFGLLESMLRGSTRVMATIPFIMLDPRTERLHSDPRFKALEAEFGDSD